MNYAEIKPIDIANGTGVRVSLFVSGCPHHCKGCFNEETWDYAYGKPYTEQQTQYLISCLDKSYIRGLTLLGGEPLAPHNQEEVLKLLKEIRQALPQKDIWCYTGYDFDRDLKGGFADENPLVQEILKLIDVLVDGPFVLSLKNPALKFRGSSNQRIIDVKSSLKSGETVLCDMDKI